MTDFIVTCRIEVGVSVDDNNPKTAEDCLRKTLDYFEIGVRKIDQVSVRRQEES